MSDYLNPKTGKVITEQELTNAAAEQGISTQELISAFNLTIQEQAPGKEMGATIEAASVVPQEMPAADMESKLEDTSLGLPEPEPTPKKGRAQVRKEELTRVEEIKEDEDVDWLGQMATELKMGTKRTLGQLARIPKYFNEIKTGIAKDILLSEDQKKQFDQLPSKVKQAIVSAGDPLSLNTLALAEAGEQYFKKAQKEVQELNKGIVEFETSIGEDILNLDIGRAAARATSKAVGSLPSIAQAFMGPVGIASIFFGSAAEASARAQEEDLPLGLKSLGYSATIGASEAALELVTRGIGKSVFKTLFKKPKDIAVKTITQIASGLAKDFGKEGLSETATEIINKTADAVFLGKEDVFKDSFSDLVDVFIVGGVAGGGLGSVRGGSEFVQNRRAKKGIDKIISSVDKTEIDRLNSLFDQAMADPITKAQFDIVKDKNSGLGLSFMLKDAVKKGEITKEQAAQSMAKFNQTQGLVRQVEKTALDFTPEKTVEVVNLLSEKAELKKQTQGVDPALASVQNERIKEIDESIKVAAQEAGKVKLEKETEIVEKLVGKEKVRSFDTAEEFAKVTGKPADADAFIDEAGDIFINKQRAAEVGAFSAASHELLHRVIKSTFTDKVASTNLVKDFNKVLESEGYMDVVQKRIDDNYRYNEDGSEKAFEEYAEEYLTSFSDAIAKEEIKFNETKFQKFMQPIVNFLRKVGYSKIDFKNGKDVYNFIKDYQKNIKKGELSERARALQAKGETITSEAVKPSVTKINEQIAALEEQYEEGELDYDDYDQQLSNLEMKLERAKKADVAEITKTKPREDRRDVKQLGDALNKLIPEGTTNKDYKEKVVGTVAAELSGKTLNPLIKKIAAGYGVVADNVYGKSWEDFYTAVKGVQFIKNLQKFNPDINDDFGGFVIGSQYGIRNRVKEALGKFKKEAEGGFKEDVSVAKGIAAEETATVTATEKAKYKNLVQQKVLSTDGLKAVRDKVVSSVRVLKSKIDAVVTKNVSVTPIVAEIRKSVGKQADIVFKKEMGGIKNNELQNYLKTHKKAILENMTTTYLSQAIPEAIQKSVGGKYLLDADGNKVINAFGDAAFVPNFVNSDVWKGAKIDREKTSTEAKGKTSGNEIMRRTPNVSQAVSDEVFLSKFIGPDGKPIRGRKESLAKAMGEEIAFDIINQDLQTEGPIYEALKNNQEALGVEIANNFVEDLSRQIERGNIKFSKTKEEVNQLLIEGIDLAIFKGVNDQQFIDLYEDEFDDQIRAIWDNELSYLAAKGTFGFKNPIKNTFAKKFPEFKNEIEEYFNEVTKPDSKKAMDQYYSFANKLADVLSADILASEVGSELFGAHQRMLGTKEGTLGNKIKSKVQSKAKESTSNKYAGVRLITGDNKMLKNFRSNILYKKFKTVEDKISAFEKLNKEEFDNASTANKALFEEINKSALKVLAENKSLIPGYLRWLESNSNIAKHLRALTGISGIEFYAENQGVYTTKDGSQGFDKLTKSQKQKLKKGDIVVNKKHPLYEDAKAFATSEAKRIYETKSKKFKNEVSLKEFVDQRLQSSTTSIVSYLKPKGEHIKSSAKMMLNVAERTFESLKTLEKLGVDKASLETALLEYGIQIKADLVDFNQTLNSKLISDKFDLKLGKTTELGDLRLLALDKKFRGTIYEAQDIQMLGRVKKEINTILDNINVEEYVNSDRAVRKEGEKQAVKFSKSESILSDQFNKMIERNKGVEADVTFSKIVAKRLGADKGKYKFYLPASAEDFRLLTAYTFAGKGKQGTADMAWFEKNLIRPYTEAIAAIDVAKQTTKNDFKALNKAMPSVAKKAGSLIPSKDYSYDQAMRVYLWNKSGFNVPGLEQQEVDRLVSFVNGNAELSSYADALMLISKSEKWLKPSEHWDAETILSDINNITEKGGRKAYLSTWIDNIDQIFSEKNLNKTEAIYGKRHREALEDTIYRMKNGTNRPSGSNAQVNKWNNWLNNSIGAIMFFNRRSAILQLLSTTNFVNWSDNNPVNAAKAFANQKQYWKDFSTIFNSDKLKQRRGGLRADVNEAEIANAVAGSKNKATSALSWLLKKGFTPTQIADSFAIASGGATFYRNRINTYEKKGFSPKEAESKAFLDFIEISDQAQQSGDPSLVSMEQASILGRMVLAFQNTTQQYARIMKRSALDIIKRRQMPGASSMLQSDFANFSRIMYYGAVQNIIFATLQNALFALIPGFGEDEDEETRDKTKQQKIERIFNGSVDSLLRGMGVKGAIVATVKNTIMEYFKQKERGVMQDHAYTVLQAVNLSPPIGSKVRKIYSGIQGEIYDADVVKERGLAITADGRLNLSPSYRVMGSLASGVVNVPLDRMYTEVQGIAEMLDERNTVYQRMALALGFRTWDVNAKNEENDLIKAEAKEVRKIEGIEKAKVSRAKNQEERLERRREAYKLLSSEQKADFTKLNKNARKKFLDRLAEKIFPTKQSESSMYKAKHRQSEARIRREVYKSLTSEQKINLTKLTKTKRNAFLDKEAKKQGIK